MPRRASDAAATLDRWRRELDQREEWLALPKPDHREVLALFTHRLRGLQDRHGDQSALREAIDTTFPLLSQHSQVHRPGFVYGLGRDHEPPSGSWHREAHEPLVHLAREAGLSLADTPWATELLDGLRTLADSAPDAGVLHQVLDMALEDLPADLPELARALVPRLDDLVGVPRYAELVVRARRLRLADEEAARRDAQPASATAPDDDSDRPDDDRTDAADDDASTADHGPDEDWVGLELTRGRRAVLIGGDPRQHTLRQYERELRLQSAEWFSPKDHRRLQDLAARIRSGAVDLVFFLARFSSHEAEYVLRPVVQETEGAEWVRIDRGYGVTQAKLALEQFVLGHTRQVREAR